MRQSLPRWLYFWKDRLGRWNCSRSSSWSDMLFASSWCQREQLCSLYILGIFSDTLYIFVHNNFPCHTCCWSLIASEVKESVEPKSTLCIHGVINNESSQACMRPVYQQGYKTSGLFTSLSIFLWQGICFIMSLSAFPWAGESYVCAQVGNE